MKIDVKVPTVGESVQEAVLAQWYTQDGARVHKDDILFLIETDKVTLEVSAEADGVLRILVPEGQTVAVGTVVGTIDTEGAAGETLTEKREALPAREQKAETVVPPAMVEPEQSAPSASRGAVELPEPAPSPSVRRIAVEKGVDLSEVAGTGPGGRVTKGDVLLHLEESGEQREPERFPQQPAGLSVKPAAEPSQSSSAPGESPSALVRPAGRAQYNEEQVTRKPMSRIRQRIAQRLLEAKQNTAMLTTFNEVDMSRVQEMRARFRDGFKGKYGVSLGIMSFFIKACIVALKEYPELNAFIEGNDIIYHQFYHVGIAVGADRGLVVPVIRHADRLSFSELEHSIVDFVKKIKENRLEVSELEGGTFTITNGGVYGSLLSTPILNTPQSGILGMHKIEDRPVVVAGQVVVRPMMYLAMSYDHRIVDGREAVSFLKRIKECIENPERIMMEI